MSGIQSIMRGRVWKFGDSVDTNQLARGGSQGAHDTAEAIKANCLSGLRPEFSQQVKPGDMLVAGSNFGCGSSRQSAVQALQVCGVAALLAESISRIYRRNSIALAFPAFVVPGIASLTEDGDEIEVDYAAGVVRNVKSMRELAIMRMPRTVEQIYESGGILQVVARRLTSLGYPPE